MRHRPTTPAPPQAWLIVGNDRSPHAHNGRPAILGAYPSRDDPELLAALAEHRRDCPDGFDVVLDQPGLDVVNDGIIIRNPAWLRVRDNWFARRAALLDGMLEDPKSAQVFTFAEGALVDPLCTHKSTGDGPFPVPRGAEWPTCKYCHAKLGFMGVLDFREFRAIEVPHGSLVLHVCRACGVCADRELWELTWIRAGEPIEMVGNRTARTWIGTAWSATEYPLPRQHGYHVPALVALGESSSFLNFSCFADKTGGHQFWIQGNADVIPRDSTGTRMFYLGQFTDSPDIVIGDCGLAYIFYSPSTGETIMRPEDF